MWQRSLLPRLPRRLLPEEAGFAPKAVSGKPRLGLLHTRFSFLILILLRQENCRFGERMDSLEGKGVFSKEIRWKAPSVPC